MNVRFLAASDAPSLRARFGDALRADAPDAGDRAAAGDAADAADLLAAIADARVLALDGGIREDLRSLLRNAGVTIAAAGDTTLLATTRAAVERARERAIADDAAFLDALLLAFARAAAPAAALRLRDRVLDLRDEARVMGIVNVTPDSFYERVDGTAGAVEKARAMTADGAGLIDIGGQSYAA